MKVSKKPVRILAVNEWTDHAPDDTAPYPDELPTVDEAEAGAELCATCGDLLAWHEQPCEAASAPLASADSLPLPGRAPGFAYAVGHRVQPAPNAPAEVLWRGQLKERHPATGLVHRINVYRLNNGY